MLCNVSFIGNVGSVKPLREVSTSRGNFVSLGFSIAAKSRKDDETIWFWCDITGARAQALEPHITKGSKLYISGALSAAESTNQDKPGTRLFVRVSEVEFFSSKPAEPQDGDITRKAIAAVAAGNALLDETDIPF